MFHHIRLSDHVILDGPGPLPEVIKTWSADYVADLTGKAPREFAFDGTGFWPDVVASAAIDDTHQTLSGDTTWTVDPSSRQVEGVQGVRPLTAAELATRLSSAKQAKSLAIDTRRDTIRTGGYPHDFGGSVGVKALQTRDSDVQNWLVLQGSCLAAVSAGQGATVGAMIRTADNTNVPCSFSDGLQTMLTMAAWGSAILARSWALKDAIAAALDQAALDAIDITTGWPPSP